MFALPSRLLKTVARLVLLPVTVARPQRILTAFRFLSQYIDILIYDSAIRVNRQMARNSAIKASMTTAHFQVFRKQVRPFLP
jgi:hypothetical protein